MSSTRKEFEFVLIFFEQTWVTPISYQKLLDDLYLKLWRESSQSGGSANSSFNSTMSSGISGFDTPEKIKPIPERLPIPIVKEPAPKPVSTDGLDLSSDSDSEIIPPAPKPIIPPVQMSTPKVPKVCSGSILSF